MKKIFISLLLVTQVYSGNINLENDFFKEKTYTIDKVESKGAVSFGYRNGYTKTYELERENDIRISKRATVLFFQNTKDQMDSGRVKLIDTFYLDEFFRRTKYTQKIYGKLQGEEMKFQKIVTCIPDCYKSECSEEKIEHIDTVNIPLTRIVSMTCDDKTERKFTFEIDSEKIIKETSSITSYVKILKKDYKEYYHTEIREFKKDTKLRYQLKEKKFDIDIKK